MTTCPLAERANETWENTIFGTQLFLTMGHFFGLPVIREGVGSCKVKNPCNWRPAISHRFIWRRRANLELKLLH